MTTDHSSERAGSDPVRIGVIGTGAMGAAHVGNLARWVTGAAVSQIFDVIEQFPESGARRRATARQLPVRGFPFLVVYRIRPDDVYVVAVAHAKRRPGYWMNRP